MSNPSSSLVQDIRALSDEQLQSCKVALNNLRADLFILFRNMPLSTVQRAIQNEIERRSCA